MINYSETNLFAQMHITDICNLRCRHCYVGDQLLHQRKAPDTATVRGWLDHFHLFAKEVGFRRATVGLTGGEPLLRPDIVELVSYAAALDLRPALLSNGIALDEAMASRLKQAGMVAISLSLEGTEVFNDSIRGFGSYRKVLKAIRVCRDQRLPVSASITVHSGSVDSLAKLLDILDPMVTAIQVRETVALGHGASMPALSRRERRRLYRLVRDHKGRSNLFSEDPCTCTLFRGPVRTGGCPALRYNFCVDVDGSIYPCRLLPVKIGQMPDIGLAWNSPVALRMRDRRNYGGACGDCELLEHCGGCRAHVFQKQGDLFGADDRCFIDRWVIRSTLQSVAGSVLGQR